MPSDADTEPPRKSLSSRLTARIGQVTGVILAMGGLLAAVDAFISQAPVTCKVWQNLPWCSPPLAGKWYALGANVDFVPLKPLDQYLPTDYIVFWKIETDASGGPACGFLGGGDRGSGDVNTHTTECKQVSESCIGCQEAIISKGESQKICNSQVTVIDIDPSRKACRVQVRNFP